MQLTDTTLQPPQVTSPNTAMLSPFLRQKQETTTHTGFCNYLASEVEGLEEKDFQTFRNEAVELLSNIESRAKEQGHQPQQPQQWTLSRSSSTTLTFMPQAFQQPQQPAAREYILTIPETQMSASRQSNLLSRAK